MTDLDDHEKIFKRAGAPWPPDGEILVASLQDAIPITDPLRDDGWRRTFFAHAQGIDADEHTTNLVKPHEYPHAFVVVRVGLTFQMPGAAGKKGEAELDGVLRWLQPRLSVRAETSHVPPLGSSLAEPWEAQPRTPFHVATYRRFRVSLSCAPGSAPREPAPPIIARCILDSLIVRR